MRGEVDKLQYLLAHRAKQAGYYRGLLEGLMAQMEKHHGTYRVSNDVYKKVKKSIDDFEAENGD